MMYKKISFVTLSVLVLCSCGGSKDVSMWENAPVVASKTTVNGESMITFDPSLLKDTIVFPLSHFMEELNFVKLDDKDEALIYSAPVKISDNYILVGSGRPRTTTMEEYRAAVPMPCKLFDKKGNFIADIGAIGQGPGEYKLIYSMQLDEKNQRVYLMPWQTDKILVYDFTGKFLDPIRLPYRTPKAVFKVEGDKVAVAIIPFKSNPSVAWVQTLTGEVLHEIPSGHFEVADFSNEVSSSQNTDAMDITFWNYPARVDTLYHINMQAGKLVPRFTIKFDTETPEQHSYMEWPDYFTGNVNDFVYISDESGNRKVEGKAPVFYLIDKKTLKGNYYRIENDYMGGERIGNPTYLFSNGYYIRNMEPGSLMEWIEKVLESDRLDEKMRKKLTDLQSTIDDDDNNYIVYAKMKK